MNTNFKISGNGEPIVLIGGLNVDHHFWDSVTVKLKKEHTVICPDNLGAGMTPALDELCSTELMAEHIIQLLDYLNIQSACIVGHSLGGCIAQKIAINHPNRVNKLVLISTYAKTNALMTLRTHTMAAMMQADIPRELIVKNAYCWLFSEKFLSNEFLVQAAIENALSTDVAQSRKTYFYQIPALLEHNTLNDLDKINSDTLIIGGGRDICTSIAELKLLKEKIANAKLEILADAAHMTPIENPDFVCQQIREFILGC